MVRVGAAFPIYFLGLAAVTFSQCHTDTDGITETESKRTQYGGRNQNIFFHKLEENLFILSLTAIQKEFK